MPDEKRQGIYRSYRQTVPGLHCFRTVVGETDLWVESSWDCRKNVETMVRSYRIQLREFIDANPDFRTTFEPWQAEWTKGDTPAIVSSMMTAAQKTGVGPMASVAGAFAGMIGQALDREDETLIIENGGDIFLSSPTERMIGIYAGESPFSQKIALRIPADLTPLGICTSAGTVGPSVSLGRADAVVVLARDAALADAAATAIGNRVQRAGDLESAARFGRTLPDLLGLLIIIGDAMTAWGAIDIRPVKN